ncbi:MAG: glutathione synthase [Neomegalonema sp.]|nr:glutathione synthase [Neomegalonema sp.]
MRLAILGDEPSTLTIEMDTSLLIAAEANRRGHDVFYAWPQKLTLGASGPEAEWWGMDYSADGRLPKDTVSNPERMSANAFDVVLMRQDPPVDERYVSITQMLDFCTVPVLNNPTDVRSFSEKISVLRLPHLCPPSIVAIDPDEMLRFIADSPEGCVLKPLNEFSGHGVLRLKKDEPDLRGLLEKGTDGFAKYVMIQHFAPAVAEGDKRIYLLEGKPIGRMNRVPAKGEWRANIHLGAQPAKFEMTPRDEEIVEGVAGLLSEYDLPITCIDIIGDTLTEINVTSPSGIPEINKIYGDGHEKALVDYIEKRANS